MFRRLFQYSQYQPKSCFIFHPVFENRKFKFDDRDLGCIFSPIFAFYKSHRQFFSLSLAQTSTVPASRKRPLSEDPLKVETELEILDAAKIAKHENLETNDHNKNEDDFFVETKNEGPLVLEPGF